MSPTGQANKTKVFDEVVYAFLTKMLQPIKTTNDQLRRLLKHHRSIDLTYDQLREVLNRLEESRQITKKKDGIFTLIKVHIDITPFVLSQDIEHKKHNTPPHAWKLYNYMKANCVGYDNRISMKQLAISVFYDPYNPEKFSTGSSERKIRDIVKMINNNSFVLKNGMPFDRLIVSDMRGNGIGGYYLPTETKEVNKFLDRVLYEKLGGLKDYWIMVNKAAGDQQIRFIIGKKEFIIRQVVSNDLMQEHLQKK